MATSRRENVARNPTAIDTRSYDKTALVGLVVAVLAVIALAYFFFTPEPLTTERAVNNSATTEATPSGNPPAPAPHLTTP